MLSNNTPSAELASPSIVESMSPAMDSRAGRPKSSSRETIADAACELFLEQGYERTSIADIATRAGVSRSSFFNYFSTKADVLWGGFDERVASAVEALAADDEPVRTVLLGIGVGLAPDSLALAIANAETMGAAEELERERALRQARIARAVADRVVRPGTPSLEADVHGAAAAGAVLAAVWAWANAGPGRTDLATLLDRALAAVPQPEGRVRQLRLVVAVDDVDDALAFYRDAAGMHQSGAFQADGGARVAILDAGRATLELANAAQVAFIDRVETDGGRSDPLRVGLEVDDAAAMVDRLVDAGAGVEASARVTPWNSLNARLRGAGGLQITLFQELGPDAEA